MFNRVLASNVQNDLAEYFNGHMDEYLYILSHVSLNCVLNVKYSYI